MNELQEMETAQVSNNGPSGPWHTLKVFGLNVGGKLVGFSFLAYSAGGYRLVEGMGFNTQQSAEARALAVIVGFGVLALSLL